MAVTLNKANLVLKDANGNIGKIEQLSNRDLAKIKTAVSDVALVVNQSNHKPIEATTTNKGVVQLATSADVVSGASDKVVTAEQLHNATTGTNLAITVNGIKPDANGNIAITSVANATNATNATNCTDKVNSSLTSGTFISGNQGNVLVNSNASAGEYTMLTKLNSTNGKFTQGCYLHNYVLQYTTNATVNAGTNSVTKSVTLLNENGDSSFCGAVTAPTFIGALSGNATSATNAANLGGYPATKYIRSVNSITPDASGNVQLSNVGAITGEIKWFAFNKVPTGYLVCNGANVSRTTYANLFEVIGTTFGSGDGSTTFNIPDLRDRYIIGANTNALGTQIAEQLPNITGNVGVLKVSETFQGSGAFVSYGIVTGTYGGTQVQNMGSLSFIASRSNSVYTDNGHVYPLSLALLPCIKY